MSVSLAIDFCRLCHEPACWHKEAGVVLRKPIGGLKYLAVRLYGAVRSENQ